MNDTTPVILSFVGDLFFSTRIESVVENLGFSIEMIETAADFGPPKPMLQDDQPAEHLEGQGALLIDRVTQWQPGLMIFDLNNRAVPWESWIALLRSSPATRRIPVLAFGSHMEVATMTRAKEVGATVVLARSKFTGEMPKLILKYLRAPDREAIQEACETPLSDLALEGIRLFNAGAYFEAHEVLEDAWNADDSAAKELYRAILQIGVAYLQIERKNYRGARKMFLRVRQWLAPLPEACRGVDLAQLKADALLVEQKLLALGEDRIGELDTGLFQPVRLKD